MFRYLIPIALLATPAAAQEYQSTMAIVNMQIAQERCGLNAPQQQTHQVAENALRKTGMDGNTLADRVEAAAAVLGAKMERERTIGEFCARMALIYARMR